MPRSDNFSFQTNGIKKCTCWKTMGFLGKQWVFGENNVVVFKAMFFDTTSHMIFFIKHMHFIQKNFSCFT